MIIVKKINKIHIIIILLSVFFYLVNANANIRPIACNGSVIGGNDLGDALCQYNNIILQTKLYCGLQSYTMTHYRGAATRSRVLNPDRVVFEMKILL